MQYAPDVSRVEVLEPTVSQTGTTQIVTPELVVARFAEVLAPRVGVASTQTVQPDIVG